MTTSSDRTTTTARRAAGAPPLVTATDFPPAQHFINGGFVDAPSDRSIDVVDPCSEDVLIQIPEGTAEDVDRAVAAAVAAKEHWARIVPKERSGVLHAIADRLAENAELVADLLPAGVVNVVTGFGAIVGARLAEHPEVDMIALTGSVNSGRAVARGAADSLKRVHLELGGKAPVVIFGDADLAAVASTLRVAGYWNSGQECGAACRVLVHETVADTFVENLVDEVGALVVGEPGAGEDVEIGPLVSKAHFNRVVGYLDRAKNEGARAAIGGSALDGPGYFVAPTVLVDVPEGAEITREEVFGPVVTVETFRDEDEAVRRANAVPYGLSASVWTENARRCHTIAARLDFGTVWVNSHLVLANEVPWGGFKGSGYGRDLSIYALDDYSRTKHVMHNHGH